MQSSSAQFHFRTAYVPHNSGHDLTALKSWCDAIVFCSTGYEAEEDLSSTIEKALENFDPDKDVIVPVGNVASNLIAGAVLARKCNFLQAGAEGTPELNVRFNRMVYKDKEYSVREILLTGGNHGKQAS